MGGERCSSCRAALRDRTYRTATGRPLCTECWKDHVALAAAGGEVVSGAEPDRAVVSAVAAGQWSSAVADDAEAAVRRRRAVQEATGWRAKLRVWLIG